MDAAHIVPDAQPPPRTTLGGFVKTWRDHERELGYFSVVALERLRRPMGLPIERDLHFQTCPVSQCK